MSDEHGYRGRDDRGDNHRRDRSRSEMPDLSRSNRGVRGMDEPSSGSYGPESRRDDRYREDSRERRGQYDLRRDERHEERPRRPESKELVMKRRIELLEELLHLKEAGRSDREYDSELHRYENDYSASRKRQRSRSPERGDRDRKDRPAPLDVRDQQQSAETHRRGRSLSVDRIHVRRSAEDIDDDRNDSKHHDRGQRPRSRSRSPVRSSVKTETDAERKPSPVRRQESNIGPSNSRGRRGRRRSRNQAQARDGPLEPLRPNAAVRPDMRLRFGQAWKERYGEKLGPDDIVVVPEFFGREGNMSYYQRLMTELPSFQDLHGNVAGNVKCGYCTIRKALDSQTVQDIRNRMIKFFAMKKTIALPVVSWRKENASRSIKFFHNNSAFSGDREGDNLCIFATFGGSRELAFVLADDDDESDPVRIYVTLGNNSLVAFGHDVNIRWKHGINNRLEAKGLATFQVFNSGVCSHATEEPLLPKLDPSLHK